MRVGVRLALPLALLSPCLQGLCARHGASCSAAIDHHRGCSPFWPSLPLQQFAFICKYQRCCCCVRAQVCLPQQTEVYIPRVRRTGGGETAKGRPVKDLGARAVSHVVAVAMSDLP